MDFVRKKKESIPSFTITIPVVHSIEDLERCLSSIDNLDYPKDKFHVVLVDCNLLHNMKQFLRKKLPKYGFRSTTLCLPKKSKIGPNWLIESRINEARNYSIQRIPGLCYVFTEDDCTFPRNWLRNFEAALTDSVGALGGPDILPQGMPWFPTALDCLLNSYLGTAGMRKGNGRKKAQYYPRKENMAIPAWIIDHVGNFPGQKPVGGDMDMAKRIRDAGLLIKFLPENPVYHRRVTSIRNFLRLTAYLASEKVRLMREHRTFLSSPYFLMLLAAAAYGIIALLALVSNHIRLLFVGFTSVYIIALLSTAVSCTVRTRSILVGVGIIFLMPLHHLSLVCGTFKGALSKLKANK